MGNRLKLWLLLLLLPVASTLALSALAVCLLPHFVPDPTLRTRATVLLLLGGFIVIVASAVAWAFIERLCLHPLKALARGTRIIASNIVARHYPHSQIASAGQTALYGHEHLSR